MSDDANEGLPVVTERVRLRIKELKWYGGGDDYNVSDFARRTDIGYATAHALLGGGTESPDATTLTKVADRMRVSVDWLLGREKDFDQRAFELGRAAASDDNVMKLEVIGLIVDEEVDPLSIRQFAESVRGLTRDDAQAQIETEALARGVSQRHASPDGNDERDAADHPEDPAKDGTNGPPDTTRHVGP